MRKQEDAGVLLARFNCPNQILTSTQLLREFALGQPASNTRNPNRESHAPQQLLIETTALDGGNYGR